MYKNPDRYMFPAVFEKDEENMRFAMQPQNFNEETLEAFQDADSDEGHVFASAEELFADLGI